MVLELGSACTAIGPQRPFTLGRGRHDCDTSHESGPETNPRVSRSSLFMAEISPRSLVDLGVGAPKEMDVGTRRGRDV